MKRTDFVFCPDDIERCVRALVGNGSCRSLLVKKDLRFFQSGPSRLVPTTPVWRSSPLRTLVFNSHQRNASHQFDYSPTPLPHWICPKSVFINIRTSSLQQDCPRLFDDLAAHLWKNKGGWLPLLKLCMVLF